MNLGNQATAEGTKKIAAKHPELTYGELGRTGLVVSQAGFGGYRISIVHESQDKALHQALNSGINLIDTSSNYADGDSEKLIGKVLTDLVQQEKLRREEVVIVTKSGYVQGNKLDTSTASYPDLIVFNETLEYCIHPDFLRDQITSSLERLQLATIDCYLLHNPEYYYLWAQQEGVAKAEADEEFLRRIELAFQYLESEVAAGRIGCYGISSNTFAADETTYERISLEEVSRIAEKVSPNHHFRLIELPLNVFETDAATSVDSKTGQTLLQLAQQQGLAVLTNRPLNAVWEKMLRRLVDVTGEGFRNIELLVAQINEIMKLENTFRQNFIMELSDEELSQPDLFKGLASGEVLQKNWYTFDSFWHWQDVRGHYFNPVIQHSLDLLTARQTMSRGMKQWIDTYVELLNSLFTNITNYYRGQEMKRVTCDKQMIANCGDADWQFDAPLSQMAIRVVRSTAGVGSVLVGMRDIDYVQDVLDELIHPVDKLPRQSSWQCLKEKVQQNAADEISLLAQQFTEEEE
jgi:aryl-alcohol dehydrogenase-like predicted oxidoreductase